MRDEIINSRIVKAAIEDAAAENGMLALRRATADVWYDFGFQTVAIYSRSGHFMKVMEVPDQSKKYEARMRYLWKLHVTGRVVLYRLPSRVRG